MIIIPDVHGRSFWKAAVEKAKENESIIFLGDYLDPYGWEGITRKDAIAGFKEIIELKKSKSDQVTLLLGNHDYHYLPDDCPVKSRYDFENAAEIQKLFRDNLGLFQIATISGKYIFSHSGILKPWVKEAAGILGKDPDITSIPGILNRALQKDPVEIGRILLIVGRERGGWSDCGSCIWGDYHEFLWYPEDQYEGYYQIFGHTQQAKDPIIEEAWACLDCRRAFRLENDKIVELKNEEEND